MPAQLEWERNGKRSTLTIFKQEVVIGHDVGCQVRGDARALEARHCRIAYDGTQFFAEHLAGMATLVNGVPIGRRNLSNGDVIECATFTVRFVEEKRARPAPSPPAPAAPAPAPAPAAPALAPAAPAPAPSPPAPAIDPAELSRLRAERDRLAHELARAMDDRDRDRDEATRLRAKLDQRDGDLRRSEDERAGTQRSLDQTRAEAAARLDELRLRDEKLVESERLVAALNGQLDDREKRFRDKLKESDAMEHELRDVERRARELFDTTNELRSEVAQGRELRRQHQAELAASMQESARLQQNLVKVTSSLAEYQQRVQQLELETHELQRERDDHRRVIEAQQEQLRILNEARQRVEILFRDLQRRHHHLDVGHELVKAEHAKLSQENAKCTAELGRLQLEIQRLLRERVTDRAAADALVAAEELRRELGQAQRAIIGLTIDRDTFERLRAIAESHTRDLEQEVEARSAAPPDRSGPAG